MTTIWIW